MEHFSEEDWVDFVRKADGTEKRNAMETHLKTGCEECRASLEFWEQTRRGAAREGSHTPPADAVRSVKGMGALYLQPKRSRFVQVAELIMDSARPAAAVAGVRSGGIAPWILLYKSGGINVDLRIEEVPLSQRISIVGQVLDFDGADQMIAHAPITVVSDGIETHRTTTNEFGEFQLEFEPAPRMYLSVRIGEEREVWIPLDRDGSQTA